MFGERNLFKKTDQGNLSERMKEYAGRKRQFPEADRIRMELEAESVTRAIAEEISGYYGSALAALRRRDMERFPGHIVSMQSRAKELKVKLPPECADLKEFGELVRRGEIKA